MTVINLEEQTPPQLEAVQETPLEPVNVPLTAAPATATPEKKKRGRKPKAPPAPPAPPVEAAKSRKRRNNARGSASDRAFQSAIAKVEMERAKTIDELSKVMEQWDVKQARLKALDWKISTLKGTTQTSSIAGMQLSPYGQMQGQPAYIQNGGPANGFMNYPPMPAAYPTQPTYVPPAMRQPAIPIDPRATGGAEGIVDDATDDDPDKFLRGAGGVIGSDRGWTG